MSDADGVKLTHIFSRIDKLAMCINGKIQTACNQKNGHYYNTYSTNKNIMQRVVLDERLRQIKSGEALFTPGRARKCSNATIATLYAYKKLPMREAMEKGKIDQQKDAADRKLKVEESKVVQSQVTQNAQLIKDYIALGIIELKKIPKVIQSFEETNGGTEGFIQGLPEE